MVNTVAGIQRSGPGHDPCGRGLMWHTRVSVASERSQRGKTQGVSVSGWGEGGSDEGTRRPEGDKEGGFPKLPQNS